MAKLQLGDELNAVTCDWCGRSIPETDITETLDGSEVCPDCISHYHGDEDAPEGNFVMYLSNIDREDA
jgi:hypothetical protein